MADRRETTEFVLANESPKETANATYSDDEEDVHYCGRCKLSFTNLSEYINHKANKVCRDTNKSTLTEVVDKLPINLNKSPEKLKEQHSEGTDGTPAKKTKGNETIGGGTSPATKRVEVQFLEPVVDAGSDSGATAEDESTGGSTEHGEKSNKPSKRHKRKNSHPKTTRKRKSSSSISSPVNEKAKETRGKKSARPSEESITVHIPESQLVHLNSSSTLSSTPSLPGVVVRKQGATSVFVPIYLNPPSKVYKCQRCPAVFQSLDEKEGHSKLHKKEFKCTLCSKSFYTASGFEQHRLNESHSHPCEECGKVFTGVVQLKKHKTTHSTDRPFSCDQCEKAFCSSANLRSHKRTVHATEKRHKCPECGKAFARKDKMKRHSLIHYPDTRPTFTCPFRSHTGCMKTFYREDKLKRHLFTHSKDKPFKCDQCNKGYARRDNLNDHMRIHTGNYSHTCTFCKKGFLGPHKLKKHMKSAHKRLNDPNLTPAMPDHPPTMVPLNSSSRPVTTSTEPVAPIQPLLQTVNTQSSAEEEPGPSSPEDPSIDDEEEAFDLSGSESGDEGTSGDEQPTVSKERLTTNTARPASSQTPGSASLSHPASHGPLPRMRPVPRVSATPQPFLPPPLPPGLHATAELMAFSQELFNVVGRFQS